jgi:hypothetical protein
MARMILVPALLGIVLSTRADAHHSFGAFYHEDQTVSIEGTITEFHYINPHAWVYVAARDVYDVVRSVGAEWSNPARLSQQGIRKDTLKPGDRVILTGSPSRDPSEYKMHLKKIERPVDGWVWAGLGERR